MDHQSKLKPEDNKFHKGNGEDKKHYWLTPIDLYNELNNFKKFLMNQQVIKEMIELIGGTKIEFNDLVISQDYKNVYVERNGEVKEWENVDPNIQRTIIMRLRILISERQ